MVDLIILGDHQETTGVAIEPVDDARAQFAGHVAERVEMKLQGRGERPPVIRFAGCVIKPAGLLMTTSASSSYTISSGMFSGASVWSATSGNRTERISFTRNRRLALTLRPFTSTASCAMAF